MIVYRITCLITHRRYIGITEGSLGRRWQGHLSSARRGVKTALHAAIRLYGAEAFVVETICEATNREMACDLEKSLIIAESTLAPNGYNLSPGGDGGSAPGRPCSPETRAKMSAAAMGKPKSLEHVAAFTASLTGRKLTSEHAAKVRMGGYKNKGKKHSKENTIAARLQRRQEADRGCRIGISGIVGVTPSPNGKWHTRIKRDSKRIRLGTYDTLEEATAVYRAAAKAHAEALKELVSSVGRSIGERERVPAVAETADAIPTPAIATTGPRSAAPDAQPIRPQVGTEPTFVAIRNPGLRQR